MKNVRTDKSVRIFGDEKSLLFLEFVARTWDICSDNISSVGAFLWTVVPWALDSDILITNRRMSHVLTLVNDIALVISITNK